MNNKNNRSTLHGLLHCLFILLLLISACGEGSGTSDVSAVTPSETLPAVGTTPTATPPPTSTPLPSATPTPEPLADIVRGNVFEPGDGDGGYLFDMEREAVAVSLEDVLWHPDDEDLFTTRQERLLETADSEQLVYRLIDAYAGPKLAGTRRRHPLSSNTRW